MIARFSKVTVRAAARPRAPEAQFDMYREVHELSTRKGFTGGGARFGRTVAQLAEPEFYFIVSPRLCFLPVPDGLSDDDPRLAGGHLELELLQSMRAVASVMRSLSDLSTPCPLHRRQSP